MMEITTVLTVLSLFSLLLVGPGCCQFQAECPDIPDPLGLHRVDCYPEGPATKEICKVRGCCYDDNIPEGDRVPSCFFPRNYGYYVQKYPEKSGNMWSATLHRSEAPTLYGNDVGILGFQLEEQSNDRLRIKFYDKAHSRSEVPLTMSEPVAPHGDTLYHVEFTETPFSVKVIRKKNSQVILDSSMGGLVFSDQYLQMSLRLSSPHVYGLGEHLHTDGLKHDMDWRTWSIHASGKHPTGPESNNLYGSHPVYLNIENDGNANMVLLLNQHAMDVVLQPSPAVTFRTIGGILDFYVFLGEWEEDTGSCHREDGMENSCEVEGNQLNTPPVQAIQNYLKAIGLPMMPPYWALGYQLSRWNYTGSDAMRGVIDRNRNAAIPYDVQWGDVDYMYNSQSFTIDEQKYPDLPDIVRDLHEHGQRYVAILDPGIKVSPPGVYPPYDDGCERDVWVKQHDGSPLAGQVWPGICVFADYSKEDTIQWWTQHAIELHKKLPFDGFWIDMNEPTNFIYGSTRGCPENKWNNPPYTPKVTGALLWNRTLCMDAVQAGGRHYDVHSLYGHHMISATYRAGLKIFGDKRFLIVSRSTFVGSGRYSGKWLGDNKSSFDDMKWSITGLIEMNMFGLPYVGADICGFFLDTDDQLCLRWTQLGAFYPMSRNHNQNNTKSQDPASFSWSQVGFIRNVLRTRYRLLPYLYTLFYRAHTRGEPVIRPLAFEFPRDGSAQAVDSQFLWGRALMISPVLTNNTFSIRSYFPKARWYNYYKGTELLDVGQWNSLVAPLDHINIHVRGGHVLPLQKPSGTTKYSRQESLSLLVAYDEYLEAEGDLYWDDGETRDSHLKGECKIVHIYASKDMLVITSSDKEGHMRPAVRLDTITMYGLGPIKTDQVELMSVQNSYIKRIEQVERNAKNNVLVFSGLDLDLADTYYISWNTKD